MSEPPTPAVRRRVRPAIRLGLLVDAGGLETWQERMLARLSNDVAEIAAVMVVGAGGACARDVSVASRVWAAYQRTRLARPGRALARRPVPRPSSSVAPVTTELEGDGRVPYRLAQEAMRVLTDARCDVIVNFTGRELVAVPAAVCGLGMWEYRVAAMTDGQRRPLRTLRPTLLELAFVRVGDDGDEAMERGWIYNVPHSVARTMDQAYFAAADWLAKICRVVVSTATLPAAGSQTAARLPLREPAMSVVVAGSAWRKLRWGVRQSFLQERWQVGVVDQPIDSLLQHRVVPQPRWLPNPSRRCFLADPFGVEDSNVVLVEQYDYLTHRGRIAGVDVSTARPTATEALSTSGHLSYPFLFTHDGTTYCIPESGDRRRAVLYRARRFPYQWEPVCTVVDGFAATDPTIIWHCDRWWLFCTDDEHGPESHLHVFHARSLTGPWKPHMRNPVKVDIRSSRPAGTPFVVDDTLIRPAQSSARGYGSGVVFNAVDVLTEDEFRERPVTHLEPNPTGPCRHGIHTVSSWGERTLVDGKREGTTLMSAVGRLRMFADR